ncbi:O-antigen ligase family protein [Teichococcus wenyumeiae]|nr:O-antigen ligase family protein [Pseudoroseomonas wenyumeiae]
MTAIATARAQERDLGDIYLRALAGLLVGYAFLGKGFAYFGIPPLFVGEMLFLGGLVMLLRSGCLLATCTAFPNLVLLILAGWVVTRTVPFLGIHGVDAIRDSVVVLYGAFAFVVCSLVIEKPGRLADALRFLGTFSLAFGASGGLLYVLSTTSLFSVITWPDGALPIMSIRSGEVASHLAGAALYGLLLRRRAGVAWTVLLLLGIGAVSAQSRGGMLAIIVPVAIAAVISGRLARLTRIVVVLGLLFSTSLALQLEFEFGRVDERTGGAEARVVSAEQFLTNALSILDDQGPAELSGPKQWRLMWWGKIQDYTLHGPYFWTGKGFGIGLAEDDGFVVWEGEGQTTVRSPHNANITMLARAGVPGLTLWIFLMLSWFAMMLRSMLEARRRGEEEWANAFLYIGCYLLGILVDSSFDVALEGPMLGIWFWCLFGLGVGASLVYRAAGSETAARR